MFACSDDSITGSTFSPSNYVPGTNDGATDAPAAPDAGTVPEDAATSQPDAATPPEDADASPQDGDATVDDADAAELDATLGTDADGSSSDDGSTQDATLVDSSQPDTGSPDTGTGTSPCGPVCTDCHGTPNLTCAPPRSIDGLMSPTDRGVGAHVAHLATGPDRPVPSRTVVCSDCHVVPTPTDHALHMNGTRDVIFSGPVAGKTTAGTPTFDSSNARCTNVYCHTVAPNAGGTNPSPTFNAPGSVQCGSCHSFPPPPPHPARSDCSQCHAGVLGANGWADPTLHINGKIDFSITGCIGCHGDANTPAPPASLSGDTSTTALGVGAHRTHVETSATAMNVRHNTFTCTQCHHLPASFDDPAHIDGDFVAEVTFPASEGSIASFPWDGAATVPTWNRSNATCSVYCHGKGTLGGANPTPTWTSPARGQGGVVCGSCHSTPPPPPHPVTTQCQNCHGGVIANCPDDNPAHCIFQDDVSPTQTYKLHVNGQVDLSFGTKFHTLPGWVGLRSEPNHHGRRWFIGNQQKEDHGYACTTCHGANLDGGGVRVSCNNTSCHDGGDWRACSFCHGTSPSQFNPPNGVWLETTQDTLAVGRHVPHVTSSASHAGFTCDRCHVVPKTGDLTHQLLYQVSTGLDTPGHHGVVTFTGAPQSATTFDVTATSGTPVTARGTCTGGCHSDARGGPPAITPFWAGGTWGSTTCSTYNGTCGNCVTGPSCCNCHAALNDNSYVTLSTGHHRVHIGNVHLPCTTCHPDPASGTHPNGTKNLMTPLIFGQPGNQEEIDIYQQPGTAPAPYTDVCGATVTCLGSCHGRDHHPTTSYGVGCW